MLTPLPTAYKDLEKEPGPKLLLVALEDYGLLETPGSKDTAKIMAMAKEVGGDIGKAYWADSVPWCGLAMAAWVKRAGWLWPKNALWALSWSSWGTPIKREDSMLGDVLVFTREGGGHVGIYVGEDSTAFHVLGGNQSDAVTITRISKARHYATRRCPWRIAQPANVRRIHRASTGKLSQNEK